MADSLLISAMLIWSASRKRFLRHIKCPRLIGLFYLYHSGVVCRDHIPPHWIISLGRIEKCWCKCHYEMCSLHRKWYYLYRYMPVLVHHMILCIRSLAYITKLKHVSNSFIYGIRDGWKILLTGLLRFVLCWSYYIVFLQWIYLMVLSVENLLFDL